MKLHPFTTIGVLLLLLTPAIFAHDVVTGDTNHDQNHVTSTPNPTMPDYSKDLPLLFVFFAGLIIFAFAMGLFLHPHAKH